MNQQSILNEYYLKIVFPIFVVLNFFNMTIFLYQGDSSAQTEIMLFVKIVRYVIYLISMYKIISNQFYRKGFIIAFLITGIVLIVFLTNRDSEFICYFLVFLALIDEPGRDIIRIHFWITLILLILTVALSQIGIINDYITSDIRARHYLGFNWVTYSSVLLSFLFLEYVYLRRGKLNIWHLCGFLVSGYWLFKKTNSRFAFAFLFGCVVFFELRDLLTRRKIKDRKWTYILVIAPWAAAFVSIFVSYIYKPNNKRMYDINTLLSERLRLGKEALSTYPIKIVTGQIIKWQGFNIDTTSFAKYNYVDCSYLQILLQFGVVFLSVVLLLYSIGIYLGIKRKKTYLSWILVFVCIFCMVEPWLIKFSYNAFLWLGTDIIKSKTKYFRIVFNKDHDPESNTYDCDESNTCECNDNKIGCCSS